MKSQSRTFHGTEKKPRGPAVNPVRCNQSFALCRTFGAHSSTQDSDPHPYGRGYCMPALRACDLEEIAVEKFPDRLRPLQTTTVPLIRKVHSRLTEKFVTFYLAGSCP
jgi:hypothetical protein